MVGGNACDQGSTELEREVRGRDLCVREVAVSRECQHKGLFIVYRSAGRVSKI